MLVYDDSYKYHQKRSPPDSAPYNLNGSTRQILSPTNVKFLKSLGFSVEA
jgi:hypothetical protein